MKHRARLERELIVGNVRGRQRSRRCCTSFSASSSVCCGSAYIKSRLKLSELRGAQFLDRAMRVIGRMNAAQCLERARSKRLRAQGHAIDARLGIARETAALNGPRIGLQRDFRVIARMQSAAASAPSRRAKSSGWNRLGVPPPKNTRVDPAARARAAASRSKSRISASMYEASGCGRLQLMRIEIAVRAFAHAPGHVHIQAPAGRPTPAVRPHLRRRRSRPRRQPVAQRAQRLAAMAEPILFGGRRAAPRSAQDPAARNTGRSRSRPSRAAHRE